MKKREVYIRYNKLLQRNLLQTLKQFSRLDTGDGKQFLICIKKILEKSAILKIDMPENLVPMQKIYLMLYKELFDDRFFSPSLISLLDGIDQKKKEKKISKIIKKLSSVSHLELEKIIDSDYTLTPLRKYLTNNETGFGGLRKAICTSIALILLFTSVCAVSTFQPRNEIIQRQQKFENMFNIINSLTEHGKEIIISDDNFIFVDNVDKARIWLDEVFGLDNLKKIAIPDVNVNGAEDPKIVQKRVEKAFTIAAANLVRLINLRKPENVKVEYSWHTEVSRTKKWDEKLTSRMQKIGALPMTSIMKSETRIKNSLLKYDVLFIIHYTMVNDQLLLDLALLSDCLIYDSLEILISPKNY